MDKWKRILAWIGIVLLLLLYACTLLSAIFVTPATQGFFKASLLATIMIPILLYGYLLVYRVIKGRTEEEQEVQKPKDKGFAEAFASRKKDSKDDSKEQ